MHVRARPAATVAAVTLAIVLVGSVPAFAATQMSDDNGNGSASSAMAAPTGISSATSHVGGGISNAGKDPAKVHAGGAMSDAGMGKTSGRSQTDGAAMSHDKMSR